MDLRRATQTRLAGWAANRPHILLTAAPGNTGTRLAVEAAVAEVGGTFAMSAADADLLVVAGEPGSEHAQLIESLWMQMPGPRARTIVVSPSGARPALSKALSELHSAAQLSEAAERRDEWDATEPSSADHLPRQSAPEQPADTQAGGSGVGHEMGGNGGHGMDMPAGLAMANRGPDRDGLNLDVLHLALGPVLPYWPHGLVVDLAIQGDVVQVARGRVLPPRQPVTLHFWRGSGQGTGVSTDSRIRHLAAFRLDSLHRLLGVAGWVAAADSARSLRDALLDGQELSIVNPQLKRLNRRLGRSRAFNFVTEGLGVEPEGGSTADAHASLQGGRASDVGARCRRWVDEAGALVAGDVAVLDATGDVGGHAQRSASAAAKLSKATSLMVGLDVAAARLVLASFDPDPDELATAAANAEPHSAHHDHP